MTLQAFSGTPLDDFLAGADSSIRTGEILQRVGLLASMLGLLLAIGLIAFLATVHRGRRHEVDLLVRVATIAAGVAAVGAVVEVAGQASIDDVAWTDALTDGEASAGMMRLLAGVLIALGLFDHSDDLGSLDADDDDPVARWFPSSASAFTYAGLVIGVFSFSFDGHTVTEGPSGLHAIVDMVHVTAGGVWFGGIVGLALIAWSRRSFGSTAELIVRFSTVAGVAVIMVALAGSLMTLMIIDGLGDLTATDWGRTLLVKVAVVGVTASIGAYNHFVVVPALESDASVEAVVRRARVTVTVEAILFLIVVTLSMLLVNASTN